MKVKKKIYQRRKRVLKGSPERPRLVVFRSNKNIYGQIVDDLNNKVIYGLSSLNPELAEELKKVSGKVEKAKVIGQKLAEKAKAGKINKVVFDRNGYLYHGRVKAFADGARNGGLEF